MDAGLAVRLQAEEAAQEGTPVDMDSDAEADPFAVLPAGLGGIE